MILTNLTSPRLNDLKQDWEHKQSTEHTADAAADHDRCQRSLSFGSGPFTGCHRDESDAGHQRRNQNRAQMIDGDF